MHFKRLFLLASASVALITATAFAVRQDDAPQMPEPTAEHKLLMERVGTWDAKMKMWAPDAPPMEATGVEKNRAVGEFHVVSEFTSNMMGMNFEGHGVSSWDPSKKKFFSIWTDSTEPSPLLMEGSYDAKTRTLTLVGENMMMGQRIKMREVVTFKDADHATFEMFVPGPDGKEMKSMQIDYTRKK
ncbi:MAG: DUF1579 domain-containing protein [Planctomycetes bacterium]|nr:DUF1579 domain-containing protein [Planctomycetota bacterium]